MKVLDLSPIRVEGTFAQKLKSQAKGIYRYGLAWLYDMQAQEIVIQQFNRILGKNFTLVRNATLPGMETPIPLIVVGPGGIQIINPSNIKGLYRVKEELWGELNKSTGKFIASHAKDNPVARTIQMGRVVDNYLIRHQCQYPPLQTALLFTQAGTHVDTQRPAVRVIQRDAIDRLGLSYLQTQPALSIEEVARIATLISEQHPIQPEAPAESQAPETADGWLNALSTPTPAQKPIADPTASRTQPLKRKEQAARPKSAKTTFSRRQLVLLAGMAIVSIGLLVTFIFLVTR